MWDDYTLGWLAALIDGEGSVMLNTHRNQNGKGRGFSLRPSVIVSNNSRELMDAIVERTGINRVYVHRRGPSESATKYDTLTWRMGVADLKQHGEALVPHLIVKRRQMELLLENIELTPAAGVWNDDSNWDRRLEIQAEIRGLNKPGKESV